MLIDVTPCSSKSRILSRRDASRLSIDACHSSVAQRHITCGRPISAHLEIAPLHADAEQPGKGTSRVEALGATLHGRRIAKQCGHFGHKTGVFFLHSSVPSNKRRVYTEINGGTILRPAVNADPADPVSGCHEIFSCVSVLENDSGKKEDLCGSDLGLIGCVLDLLLPCPSTTSENSERYHGLNQVPIKIISRLVNVSKLIQSTHDT